MLNDNNLQKNQETLLPPRDGSTSSHQIETITPYRKKLEKDRETYGDIFYDMEKIVKENVEKNKRLEENRNYKIKKAENLKNSWELMRVCRNFIQENEGDWLEGIEKSNLRREKILEEEKKKERFRVVERKKGEIKTKKLQSRINFATKSLGSEGKKAWGQEIKKERLEIAEAKENIWKWRENGGGKTKKGKEKKEMPKEKELEEKLGKLLQLIEKEKIEAEAWRERKDNERKEVLKETEKKRMRLDRKKKLEEKWQTLRWVTRYLEENLEEFCDLLENCQDLQSTVTNSQPKAQNNTEGLEISPGNSKNYYGDLRIEGKCPLSQTEQPGQCKIKEILDLQIPRPPQNTNTNTEQDCHRISDSTDSDRNIVTDTREGVKGQVVPTNILSKEDDKKYDDGFEEDSIDIDQEVDVMEFADADTYTDTDKKNVVRLFGGEVPLEGIRISSDLIVSKPSTGMQQNMILEDNMTITDKSKEDKMFTNIDRKRSLTRTVPEKEIEFDNTVEERRDKREKREEKRSTRSTPCSRGSCSTTRRMSRACTTSACSSPVRRMSSIGNISSRLKTVMKATQITYKGKICQTISKDSLILGARASCSSFVFSMGKKATAATTTICAAAKPSNVNNANQPIIGRLSLFTANPRPVSEGFWHRENQPERTR